MAVSPPLSYSPPPLLRGAVLRLTVDGGFRSAGKTEASVPQGHPCFGGMGTAPAAGICSGDRLDSSLVHVYVSSSLAVHPDKVRVASGQMAGVDKDGKVRPCTSQIPEGFRAPGVPTLETLDTKAG